MDLLNRLNWVDILVWGILGRIVYIGIKQGFVTEFFKLLGVTFAVFFTLHYYSSFSKFLQKSIHFPESMTNIFCFALLWATAVITFKFIRDGITLLFKL